MSKLEQWVRGCVREVFFILKKVNFECRFTGWRHTSLSVPFTHKFSADKRMDVDPLVPVFDQAIPTACDHP
eukprot:m.67158 g.67158  ORF g.67158 m.67158 type:complete len:71 (+) comp19781_c0_seq2:139-351(+)